MKMTRTRIRRFAFLREDNGKIVWVDWTTMIRQEAGFITLPDGVSARRCVHLEGESPHRVSRQQRAVPMPVVSDSLGFPAQAFRDREAQRQKWGCTDIEFRRDPRVPEFYQVHCASESARDRYAKHRNMVNRTGSLGGGVMLSQEDLDRAAEIASRRWMF